MLASPSDEGPERELARIVDRLRTMPLSRLESIQPHVRALAEALVSLARDLGDPAPATVPVFSAHASADVIMVLGRDALSVARTDEQRAGVAQVLTEARRALP